MELIHCVYMASTENVMFHGSRWSRPIDARATCGRWKFLSKYTTAAFAEPWFEGPPHANGMLAMSIEKVGTRSVVPPLPEKGPSHTRSTCSRPVFTNAFDTHTYGGRPLKMPTPPRTSVLPSPRRS